MAWRGRFAALLLLVALFSSRAVEGGDAPQDPAAVEKQLAEKDTRIAELERELRVVGGAHAGGRSRGGASLRAEATLEERVKALEKTVSSVNVTSMDEQVAPPRIVPFQTNPPPELPPVAGDEKATDEMRPGHPGVARSGLDACRHFQEQHD
ncbi:hypothetical protein T484DRAFT_1768292 [Baffinella frigidus]|nr:hypothetical protein T484DRAFT_1768292 [Cryptophyta sp. CCMP2293]